MRSDWRLIAFFPFALVLACASPAVTPVDDILTFGPPDTICEDVCAQIPPGGTCGGCCTGCLQGSKCVGGLCQCPAGGCIEDTWDVPKPVDTVDVAPACQDLGTDLTSANARCCCAATIPLICVNGLWKCQTGPSLSADECDFLISHYDKYCYGYGDGQSLADGDVSAMAVDATATD